MFASTRSLRSARLNFDKEILRRRLRPPADALQSNLLPLARLSIDDQISPSTDRTVRRRIESTLEQSIFTPEQCQQLLETFRKYSINKNDDGSTIIDERSSQLLLNVLIELAKKFFDFVDRAVGFPQTIELLLILDGHGSGHGHRQLFPAAAHWFSSCVQRMSDDLHPNLLERSVHLLFDINDILLTRKHFSRLDPSKGNLTSDESTDDEEGIPQSTLVPLPHLQDDQSAGHRSDLCQCLSS